MHTASMLKALLKDSKILAVVIFLLLSVFAGVMALSQRFIKPQAAPGEPILTFTVENNQQLHPGDNFNLLVHVDPNGTSYNAYSLQFSFDPAVIGLQNPSDVASNIEELYPNPIVSKQLNGNTLIIEGGSINSSISTAMDLFRITMRVNPSTTATVANIPWSDETQVMNFTLEKHNGSFSIIQSTQNTVDMYFDSPGSFTTYAPGQNLDLMLYLNPHGKNVRGFEMNYVYDPAVITFQNATPTAGNTIVLDPSSGFDTSNHAPFVVDTVNHRIYMSMSVGANPNVTGTLGIRIATLRLRISQPLPAGTTSVSFAVGTGSSVSDENLNNVLRGNPTVYTLPLGGTITGSPTPTPQNGISPSPTPTRSVTPSVSPTVTPGASHTPTPSPTPPSGRENYIIDIGMKDTLEMNIAGATDLDVPHINFAVRLFGVEHTPNIRVRLKASDMVVKLTPAPANQGDGCHIPGWGEYFYSGIEMSADVNGVYHPVPGSTFTHNSQTYTVASDGWVPLVDLSTDSANHLYAFSLKGPMHRSSLLETNVALDSSENKPSSQNYDWTDEPLEPGDLSDPNNNYTQDCVANMVDMSLVISRHAATDTDSLRIADVDYNGVVNAADISKVDHTLQTKPDDE